MNMKWIISADTSYYKVDEAFDKKDYVDWRQTANYNIGDIIYIYCIRPIKKIMFKTVVEKTEMPFDEASSDKEFFVNEDDYSKDRYDRNMRLKLLQKVDSEKLTLDCLIDNGLKRAPQGPMRLLNENLEKYINKVFKDDNGSIDDDREFEYEREVISIPASGTIDLIYKYKIHSHPDNKKGYPYKTALYYTFRKKGGIMEKLYKLEDTVSFNPDNIIEIESLNLSSKVKERLKLYINDRRETYGFSEEGNYKFYILGECLQLNKPVKLPGQNNQAYFRISEMFSEKDIVDSYNNDIDEEEKYIEGAVTTIKVNKYERNLKARRKCLEHYGYKCFVCGFDFEEFYGDIGKEIIEVHHNKALNQIKKSYEVNPIKDLRPVCSNCHTIIHSRKPNYQIDELKIILRNKNR